MTGLAAGSLNRRITLQAPVVTRDAYGGAVTTWSDVATVWAAVIPMRGRELFAAQQVVALAEIKIRMRYRAGVDEAMRIVFDGKHYGIQHIAEIGYRDGLELLVSKPQ